MEIKYRESLERVKANFNKLYTDRFKRASKRTFDGLIWGLRGQFIAKRFNLQK
jgi:hypothetical protein